MGGLGSLLGIFKLTALETPATSFQEAVGCGNNSSSNSADCGWRVGGSGTYED